MPKLLLFHVFYNESASFNWSIWSAGYSIMFFLHNGHPIPAVHWDWEWILAGVVILHWRYIYLVGNVLKKYFLPLQSPGDPAMMLQWSPASLCFLTASCAGSQSVTSAFMCHTYWTHWVGSPLRTGIRCNTHFLQFSNKWFLHAFCAGFYLVKRKKENPAAH